MAKTGFLHKKTGRKFRPVIFEMGLFELNPLSSLQWPAYPLNRNPA